MICCLPAGILHFNDRTSVLFWPSAAPDWVDLMLQILKYDDITPEKNWQCIELHIKHIAAQLSLLCTTHDPFCDQPPHLCRIRSKLSEVIEGVRYLRTINNNFVSQGIQRHHSLQMYRSVVGLKQIPSCKSIANRIECWDRCMIISAGTLQLNNRRLMECPKLTTRSASLTWYSLLGSAGKVQI